MRLGGESADLHASNSIRWLYRGVGGRDSQNAEPSESRGAWVGRRWGWVGIGVASPVHPLEWTCRFCPLLVV